MIRDKTGVIDIGLKSECALGALTFGNGQMEADFHCLGTVAVAMDRLNRRVSGLYKKGAARRKNQAPFRDVRTGTGWIY